MWVWICGSDKDSPFFPFIYPSARLRFDHLSNQLHSHLKQATRTSLTASMYITSITSIQSISRHSQPTQQSPTMIPLSQMLRYILSWIFPILHIPLVASLPPTGSYRGIISSPTLDLQLIAPPSSFAFFLFNSSIPAEGPVLVTAGYTTEHNSPNGKILMDHLLAAAAPMGIPSYAVSFPVNNILATAEAAYLYASVRQVRPNFQLRNFEYDAAAIPGNVKFLVKWPDLNIESVPP